MLHAVIEFASKIAVSCGSGTRHGVAHPEVVNHIAHDQFADAHVFAYWVAGVVNVIHEFHPQSQESQVIADRFQDPAHAHNISAKSEFVTVTVAAVIVL